MPNKTAVKVAVENTAYHFDRAYSYLLPESLEQKAQKGCRVMVPFGAGNKLRQGVIIEKEMVDSTEKLKSVSKLIDEKPLLSDEMLQLVLWLKERTFCTVFEAFKAVLPVGVTNKTVVTYTSNADADVESMTADEKTIYEFLQKSNGYKEGAKILAKYGFKNDADILSRMAKKGYLVTNTDAVRRLGDKTIRMVRLTPAGLDALGGEMKISQKQGEILSLLKDVETASVKEICYFTGFTPAVVSALERKGLVEYYDNEISRNPYENIESPEAPVNINLTDEQQKAYDDIMTLYNEGKGGVSLLYGVTGSGKTSVYLKLIDDVLSKGKNVIAMVPEISLTPQTLNLFHKRYGKKIAVFHSALSVGQRADEWKRVKNGEASIVIGTRSAVFAPFQNIGLIIIDEEQEHTYKSEQTPRYNAKDVARFRCAANKAVLVLASATPSVESFAAAKSGRYKLSTLTKRYADAGLPQVKIVDMLTEADDDNNGISKPLAKALYDNLQNHKQSILLMNRRGFNTYASCKSCGNVVTCPSCSISMTYHHANGRLMCHYCGYSIPFTKKCPSCQSTDMRYSGIGTQRVEEQLQNLLPDARVLRMDADTTMSRFAHEEKLTAFANGEYDIMLGTQMVAKGLDFENVTLVGVISADSQLFNDDFRSQERTFDLITQVVGRSGRGKYKGTALIQTINPENEVIRLAAEQDYDSFFKEEIDIRKMLIYPPFCDICLIGFSGEDETMVRTAADVFFEYAKPLLKNNSIIAMGPMAARVVKISNKYRYRLILKCKNNKDFRKALSDLMIKFGKNSKFSSVSVYVDINPQALV
ncbi:MAG: primosomal protein N' [Clostridia bacterium]|nr:primosomal protein N' [Clostridia bacterium]